MKANHHDVQYRPPGSAIASPPGLLHGRPPRARKTTTSTAKGGGPGDPAVPRRTASSGLQVSAGAPHEGRAVARRRPKLLQLRAAPRAGAALPSSASAASGLSPDAAAAAREAGRGRTLREPDGAGPGAGWGWGWGGTRLGAGLARLSGSSIPYCLRLILTHFLLLCPLFFSLVSALSLFPWFSSFFTIFFCFLSIIQYLRSFPSPLWDNREAY